MKTKGREENAQQALNAPQDRSVEPAPYESNEDIRHWNQNWICLVRELEECLASRLLSDGRVPRGTIPPRLAAVISDRLKEIAHAIGSHNYDIGSRVTVEDAELVQYAASVLEQFAERESQ